MRDYTIAAVARALELLISFEEPPHEFGGREVARRLSASSNQAFRILKTLEAQGFVERVGDRYRIGLRAYTVGQAAVRRDAIARLARPILAELHDATGGQLVYLMVPDVRAREAVYIDVVPSRHEGAPVRDIGMRTGLDVGATPKVLLAFQDQQASPPSATAQERVLSERLAQIRRDGYALTTDDSVKGGLAAGAPVFNGGGSTIAAIGVAGLSHHFDEGVCDQLPRLVADAAIRLSTRFGYPPSSNLA